MAKLYLISLGCNKNLVDSEVMLGRLSSFELTDEPSEADALIVNTCGFIDSAKEESIRAILQLAAVKKNGAILAVTGCLMERYKEELIKELPEVDIFTGVGDFERIDELIINKQSRFSPEIYLAKSNAKRVITGSSYHAYIKIAEGCNQNCSFCAIPSFKGRLKSRDISDIAAEVKELASRGYCDFSFIAQDTSSFGKDLSGDGDSDLIRLIDEIEKIKGIKTARILYLYPTSTSETLINRIIKSDIFVNYFDMPIQHISDSMLKTMRRGHNAAKLKELLNMMRAAPDSFLRTGIIVGHPGEGEEDFKELCEFLKAFEFDRISAFAYSKEDGTLAANMPQIPSKTITKRLNEIEKITKNAIKNSLNKLINKKIKVYINGISSEGEAFWGAKSVIWDRDIDGEILINDSVATSSANDKIRPGDVCECYISEIAGNNLIGQI